jgi:hypothetical protein
MDLQNRARIREREPEVAAPKAMSPAPLFTGLGAQKSGVQNGIRRDRAPGARLKDHTSVAVRA